MTEEQFKKNIDELVEGAAKFLRARCIRLVRSGAVDLESAEDNFVLPKIVFTAAMFDGAAIYAPLTKKQMKEVNNLRKF